MRKHNATISAFSKEDEENLSGIEGFNAVENVDVLFRLLQDRIVLLTGNIDQSTTDQVVSQLLYLDRVGKDPVNLYIDCRGGDLNNMFTIYDVMHHVRCIVKTLVIGQAFSGAGLILAAGHPGERAAFPNALIMIHQPKIDPLEGGDIISVSTDINRFAKETQLYCSMISKHSGQTLKKVFSDLKNDMFLTPKEALEYGLIDKVLRPKKKLTANRRISKTRNIR